MVAARPSSVMTRPTRTDVAAESLPPHRVADHHDRVRLRVARVFCGERSSVGRAHAEQRKQRRRHRGRVEARRVAGAGHRHLPRAQRRRRRDGAEAAGEVEVVGLGKREGIALRRDLAEPDDPIRIGERERPQHDGVDDAERCRRTADAHREREDDGDRESRRGAQTPNRVTQVLQQRVHHCLRPGLSTTRAIRSNPLIEKTLQCGGDTRSGFVLSVAEHPCAKTGTEPDLQTARQSRTATAHAPAQSPQRHKDSQRRSIWVFVIFVIFVPEREP